MGKKGKRKDDPGYGQRKGPDCPHAQYEGRGSLKAVRVGAVCLPENVEKGVNYLLWWEMQNRREWKRVVKGQSTNTRNRQIYMEKILEGRALL